MEKDSTSPKADSPAADSHDQARRQFLVQCGRYAVITPPVVTVLLSVSQSRYATAASGAAPRSGAALLSGSGSFAVQGDSTCAQAQSGVFVGDAPGCVRLRSHLDPPR
jgi:hypothetical protein